MDEWARRDPDGPSDVPRVEIPLAGGDVDPDDEPAGRRGPSWRKVVAASGVAGVVLGIVVGVVIVADGDDDDESTGTTTTLDLDELSSSITVPPTLGPIESDGSTTGRGVAPLPTIVDADPDALGAYDLDAALATLDENAPRRAHTRYVAGADGFVLDVEMEHDSLNDRYRIELEFDADDPDRQRILLDARGEWSYVTAGEEWLRVSNEQIAQQTGSVDVGALARSILLGPVRSDTSPTVAAAAGLASLDGTPVREYTVEVEASAVPEWVAYVFAPSAEVPPPPTDDLLTFTVHVDGDARLRRVAGASAYGSTEQSIVHTVERLPRLPVIDLPTSFAILDENGNVVTDSAELVPQYEPVTGEPPAGGYDLGTALATLTESPPLRATAEMLGVGTLVTTAELDPDTEVVAVTFGAFDDAAMLVETTSGRAFIRNEDGSYEHDRLVAGAPLVAALLSGATDPGVLADAEPVRFVRRDDDRTVRRFDTTVPLSTLRSSLFLNFRFGEDPDAPLPVRVFVDEASRVVELHVLSTGRPPLAMVQRFEHEGEAPTVTLPADSG